VKKNINIWQNEARRKLNFAYVLLYDEMLDFLWSEDSVRILGRLERLIRKTFPDQEKMEKTLDNLVESGVYFNNGHQRTQDLRYAVEKLYNAIEEMTPENNTILLSNKKYKREGNIMKIINSEVTAPRKRTPVCSRTKVQSDVQAPVESQVVIQSSEDNTMTAVTALGLISGSCDELGEKLSLAIASKQFPGFEEQTAKLVADLFSIAVSAENLLEEMNPVQGEE
jgi:hypothetical protein